MAVLGSRGRRVEAWFRRRIAPIPAELLKPRRRQGGFWHPLCLQVGYGTPCPAHRRAGGAARRVTWSHMEPHPATLSVAQEGRGDYNASDILNSRRGHRAARRVGSAPRSAESASGGRGGPGPWAYAAPSDRLILHQSIHQGITARGEGGDFPAAPLGPPGPPYPSGLPDPPEPSRLWAAAGGPAAVARGRRRSVHRHSGNNI